MKRILITPLLLLCLLPLACKKKPEKGATGLGGGKSAIKLPDEVVRKLEALRRAGEPTTVEELKQWVNTPPLKTNAAPLYEKAFSALPAYGTPGRAFLDGISRLPPRNLPMPKATLDALAKFCTENASLLDSLHTATQVKECMYPVDFKDDMVSTLLPHLAKVKQCSGALLAETYLAVEKGDTDKAVESFCKGIALAESEARGPYVIDQLVRLACLGLSEKALERLVNRRRLSASQLEQVAQALQSVTLKQSFRRAILAERCSPIVIFQLPTEKLKWVLGSGGFAAVVDAEGALASQRARAVMDGKGDLETTRPGTNRYVEPDFDWESYRESATYVRDFLFGLENYETIIKAFETPFPESLSVAKEFSANISIAVTNRYLFSSLMNPALGAFFVRYARAEAQLRVMRGVLAIEKMRLEYNGRLPEQADNPAVTAALAGLTDPFDGKSIRYKRRAANSYVVYSLGPDGKEDSGIPVEASTKGQNIDALAFLVTR